MNTFFQTLAIIVLAVTIGASGTGAQIRNRNDELATVEDLNQGA